MSHAFSLAQGHPSAQAPSSISASRKDGRLVPFTPTPHRFFCENALIDHYGPRIGLEGVAVYCALQRYANRQTGQCWPSVATLAKQLGTSQPRIRKYLGKLAACGLVDWQARYSTAGERTSNLYTVHAATRPTTEAPTQVIETEAPNNLLPPPEQNPPQGQNDLCQEQDLEQEKRTRGVLLSELKKTTPSIVEVDRSTSPAYAQMHAKQQRCPHPLRERYQPYEGYQRCQRCNFDQFPVITTAPSVSAAREVQLDSTAAD
jgi:hypothetical protein